MNENLKMAALLGLGMTGLLVCGCGAKKIETTEVPKEPQANEAVTAAPAPQPEQQKYVVKAGDTLWAISDQMGIYSDHAQWPLIFKTNRDEILDPDEIKPGEILSIQKGQSPDQIAYAKQLANDTPKFVSHEAPRNPLPVNYF